MHSSCPSGISPERPPAASAGPDARRHSQVHDIAPLHPPVCTKHHHIAGLSAQTHLDMVWTLSALGSRYMCKVWRAGASAPLHSTSRSQLTCMGGRGHKTPPCGTGEAFAFAPLASRHVSVKFSVASTLTSSTAWGHLLLFDFVEWFSICSQGHLVLRGVCVEMVGLCQSV